MRDRPVAASAAAAVVARDHARRLTTVASGDAPEMRNGTLTVEDATAYSEVNRARLNGPLAAGEHAGKRRSDTAPGSRAPCHRVTTAEQAMLASRFSQRLLSDLDTAISGYAKPEARAMLRRASNSLLVWVADGADNDAGRRRFAVIYRKGVETANRFADIQRVSAIVSRWYAAQLAEGRLTPLTCYSMTRSAASALQLLGGSAAGRYPAFERRFFRASAPRGRHAALGRLDWPELLDLTGLDRERAALSLVRSTALEEFDAQVEAFDFGREVLDGQPRGAGVDEDARSAIRTVLLGARSAIKGRSGKLIHAELVSRAGTFAASRATWAAAGMPTKSLDRWFCGGRQHLNRRELGSLSLSCISASLGSALASGALLCCELGWNRQPIFSLPRNPIAFTTREACGLGGMAFLRAFKVRAGHDVVACAAEGLPLLGLFADRATQAWDEVESEYGAGAGRDGRTLLKLGEHAQTLRVLADFGRMADASRDIDAACRMSPYLFVFPSMGLGKERRWAQEGGLSSCHPPLFKRLGLTFPAIRGTIANVHYGASRSTVATAAYLGNSPRVAWRHYLDSPVLQQELQAAGRFFTDALQGMLVSGRPGAADGLGVHPDALKWFADVARVSGIAAAIGVVPAPGSPTRETLRFDPTDAALADLFLLHWAAVRARLELPPATWRVRCRDLLAIAKVVGSHVFRAGLRRHYWAAARAAHRALVAGDVALPPVGGV